MKIKTRDVNDSDLSLLFKWANDPETRKQSFNSKEITWETHSQWFQEKVDNPNCFFHLFTADSIPAGIVRIEKSEQTIISVTVAPDQRGKGLGCQLIKTACNKFWSSNINPIFAYIKKENSGSVKAFEKAGFIIISETVIADIPSLILKATKHVDWFI